MRRSSARKRCRVAASAYPLRVSMVALCLLIVAATVPARFLFAQDDNMMLTQPQPQASSSGWAWLSLGLAVIAYGVAANDYQETEYNITKAKQAYSKYEATTDPNLALLYRDQTTTFDHRALAYESTTNAAIAIGIALTATALTIFHNSGKEDQPFMLSDRGVQWTYRF